MVEVEEKDDGLHMLNPDLELVCHPVLHRVTLIGHRSIIRLIMTNLIDDRGIRGSAFGNDGT